MKANLTRAVALCFVAVISITDARALTLSALCAQDEVARDVARFAKSLWYPPDAKRMKPDTANFDREAGSMSCIFGLTAGNVYDFGNYKATFKDVGVNRVRVISLTPID